LHSYMKLLILSVTADLDHFHAVEKRTGNRLKGICRSDEHDLREIQRHFQVVVPEPAVLLAVQHFQKRGESIPFIVCAYFIDLIQQHNRIFHTSRTKSVRDAARHCAYICLPVSSDLSLISYAAQGNTNIRFLKSP